MNICDQIESLFKRIDRKIDTLINSINEFAYSNQTVNVQENLNEYRSKLTIQVEENLKQIMKKIDENYKKIKNNRNQECDQTSIRKALTNQCFLDEFKPSELNLIDVDYQHVIYKNDFNFLTKLKHINLLQDNIRADSIRLNEIYHNRSNVFIHPLSKLKLFVHYKSTNLVQVLLRKYANKTTVLRALNLNTNFYCRFYIYNTKIVANLIDKQKSILNVYDSNLKLIRTKQFDQQINVVFINSNNELVYWSYSDAYVILNLDSLEHANENINLNTINDKLLHVSSKRLFYLGYGLENNPVINIYDRKTHELINFILVNCSSSHYFKFDSLSRIYVKTNDKADTISCFDENGVLFKSSSLFFQFYDQFEFIDDSTINFVDYTQNNIILF